MPLLDQLLINSFGLSASGYTGSQGSTGYSGSSGTNGINGYTGSAGQAGTSSDSPKITAITYPGDDTAADVAGGQTITITGVNFVAGATVFIDTTQASVVSVVNSTTITFTAPTLATGSYIVYVINPDGGSALAVPGIQYSGTPTWTTGAGTLGSANKQTSFTANVVATGDAPITYSVYSGSLPSGLILTANTGVISGTTPNVASSTTYNFTVRATDAQRQDTDRAFSIAVIPSNEPATVEYLVVAGGGGGGGSNGGGGGAGGFRTATGLAVATGSAITVTIGAGGTGGVGYVTTAATNGGNSVFGSITSTGGGAGATESIGGAGATGGSGGGGNGYTGGGNGAAGVGTAGQGNNGGAGATGTSNYRGGGGGGAGAAGIAGNTGTSASGSGGVGLSSSISGSATYYSGGGGGGGYAGTAGAGGTGGGGAGSVLGVGIGGTVNTGGGGGGGYNASNGAAGGSGTVIIRYADTFSAATSTTGSPTVINTSGYRIYKWTTSGSITF